MTSIGSSACGIGDCVDGFIMTVWPYVLQEQLPRKRSQKGVQWPICDAVQIQHEVEFEVSPKPPATPAPKANIKWTARVHHTSSALSIKTASIAAIMSGCR